MGSVIGGQTTAVRLLSRNPAVRREAEREATAGDQVRAARIRKKRTGQSEMSAIKEIAESTISTKQEGQPEAEKVDPKKFGVKITSKDTGRTAVITKLDQETAQAAAESISERKRIEQQRTQAVKQQEGQSEQFGPIQQKETQRPSSISEQVDDQKYSARQFLGPTLEEAKPFGQKIANFFKELKAPGILGLPPPKDKPTKTKGGFLDRAKFGEVAGGFVPAVISFPRERPLETAGLFIAPPVLKGFISGGKIVAGKIALKLFKKGAIGTKAVNVLTKAGAVTEKVGEAALGTTFAVQEVKAIASAETPGQAGAEFGKGLTRATILGVGMKAAKPGRLTEIYEAKVGTPLTVAGSKEFGTVKNVEFAEAVGSVGIKLSKRSVNIQPKRDLPLGQVEGITQPDVRKISNFLRGNEQAFGKGSVGQSTFLDKELAAQQVKVKGGKFPDVDVAAVPSKFPQTKVKVDIKDIQEATKIVGTRPREFTPGGQSVQSFQEQSLRKAIGGFQEFPREGEQVAFGRLGKDIRDLSFNIKQATREGFIKETPAIRTIEKAIAGNKEVTLPLFRQEGFKFTIAKPKPIKIKFTSSVGKVFRPSVVPISVGSRISRPSRSPRPSASKSFSPSVSPSISKLISSNISPSPSKSISKSISSSISPKTSISPSISKSFSRTFSFSPSVSSTTSRTFSPSPSISPYTTTSIKIPPSPFKFNINLEGKKRKSKKNLERQFRFTPNLKAVAINIKGSRPGLLTGLETRPVKY